MSFSSDLKNEITESTYKKICCRHSLLRGAVLAKGEVFGDELSLRVGDNAVAEFILSLVFELYGKEPSVRASRSGGVGKELVFTAPSLAKYIVDIEYGASLDGYFKCPACRAAFFRGIFLTAGRVADPEKQFSLEFSAPNRIDTLSRIFKKSGIDIKVSKKRAETVLYTKNSYFIEDFFSLAELNGATFSIINTKITNDFKNNANRHRNFDTVNITKSVAAAESQLEAIRMLDERGLLSSLPPELEATARLRLLHPDMSLYQLSLSAVPPVSKSGMAHRLKKITELADMLTSSGNKD